VFYSNSTDAVRFVNLLLSNKSSGPSVSDGAVPVWMLRNYVAGVGNPSDYVMRAEDLYKINYLVDNPLMGLIGCHLEGKYIGALPKEAVPLVEPIVSINRVRTATNRGRGSADGSRKVEVRPEQGRHCGCAGPWRHAALLRLQREHPRLG